MTTLLRIASCQFAVEGDVLHNRAIILRQIAEAAERGARVAHFCEAALTGYAGVDLPDFEGYDFELLRESTEKICQAAKAHRMWVLLGSAHPLTPPNRPHNCVYVISDQGQIVNRYDKRFCTGLDEPVPELDLAHYSPGNRPCVFEVDGRKCAALICYDYRFPELYRELKRLQVQVLFQSFHNARRDRDTHENHNVWKDIVPATMMCHAATNHFFVSATNSSAEYSSWPGFTVRPDGLILGRLEDHREGVLISELDFGANYWDAPAPWRDRAMQGRLYSGCLVDDPRSEDRTSL